MSRRRSNQPTISLFSFQDIITSVTAILILILLILTVELVTQSVKKAAADPAATTRSLADAVADMAEVVAALEKSVANAAPLVTVADKAAAARTAKVLRDQIEWARQQLADARAVETAARMRAEAATKLAQAAEQEKEIVTEQNRSAKDRAARAEDLAAENARRRAEVEADPQAGATPSRGGEVVFTRDEASGRQPWLLEVSAAGMSSMRLGSGTPVPLGRPATAGSQLDQWLSTLNPSRDHILLLIRPSGTDISNEVRGLLRSRDIPFGVEIIGEETVIHDGAAPSPSADDSGESP